MRKHFLLLFLLTLLPLSGWAVDFSDSKVTITVNNQPYNTALATIKAGISVKIDGTALTNGNTDDKWTWDQKFYTDETGAAQATVATGITTPKVGTYYIKITAVDGSGNSGSKFAPIIIEKADLKVADNTNVNDYTAPTAVASLTYNGTAQTLISAGQINTTGTGATGSAAKCGTFTYKLSTESSYAAALPKGTDAKTYTVNWKLSGSENYNEATGSINVTIAGKALTALTANNAFTFTAAASYTYTGTAQAPTFIVKDGTTDITSYVDVKWYPATLTNNTYAKTANATALTGTPVEAGVYIAELTGKSTSNYDANTVKSDNTWGFTIAKKVIQIKIVNKTSTYNGQPVSLDDAKINYPGLCAADAEASVDNFGGQLNVAFATGIVQNNTNPKDVKRDNNGDVQGYGLVVSLGNGFANTALSKNYQIMYNNNASDIDATSIASVTGTYTINPVAISIKPRTIKMEYGSNAPIAPAAATVDAAASGNTPAVVGTVEFTSGQMVVVNNTAENILAALKFNVATNARDADNTVTPAITQITWAQAVKGTYTGKLTLSIKAQENNESQNITDARNAANNYDIDFVPGDVEVIGQPLTVYVIGGNVEYGSDPDDWTFTYDAGGLDLKATPSYKIYDLDDNEIESEKLQNLARGTYQVKMVEDSENLSPDNYTITNYEPGFLVVTKKKITITINPLIVNVGTTKAQLNQNASVADYSDQLVGDDTEVSFTYSFNTTTNNEVGKIPSTVMDNTNTTDLGANSQGTYANGITAAIIERGNAQQPATGYVAANDNYDVTFVGGSLTVVAGQVLYLAQDDAYLIDKIKDAAAAGAAQNPTTYTINFDNRQLKREVWAAMVLPFETSVTEISTALGYAVVDVLDVDNTSNDMHLKLHMGKIAANQPFIVKYYKEDVYGNNNQITTNNATLTLSTVNTLTQKTIVYDKDDEDYVNADGNVFVENTHNGHQFIGVYKPVEVYGANYKWIARGNGNLVDASNYTEDNKAPMRRLISYFKLNPSAQNARILIDEPDGTTTVIDSLTAETMNVQAEGWYTLNGVKLQGVPTQKGIYINNGKKIVIK